MNQWNWQKPDWPNFTYNADNLKVFEEEFLLQSGMFLGALLHFKESEKQRLAIEIMSNEALKTSEIEGEILDRESVQSSIQCRLGLRPIHTHIKPAEAGIGEMIVHLYRHYQEPL